MKELKLKYGCNPNQIPARIYMQSGADLPITVLNGRPGYINFLDAFNSWQLVRELRRATGLPAAASFKHVSPAGAAVGLPLTDTLKKIYSVEGMDLSPLASAYARARGADRMSSFGDFVALSDVCDKSTALVLQHEVSDGVIAPGYEPEALEILSAKKKGKYNVIQIDPAYEPEELETKQVFGITFEQKRNNDHITEDLLQNRPTKNKEIPEAARRDLLIAAVMIILETAFEMVIPVLMADIIDVGVANRDVAVILQRGIQMGVCALLALATGLLYARFTARAAYGWGANIREAQFERVQKYAFSNLDKFETSSLVTRMTTDVTVLQNTVNGGYRPLVRSPVMLVMGVGLSFWMNPRLALVFLVCAPVLGGVLFVIVRRVAPMYGRLQKAVDRLNNVVQEGLTAIRAVKAFVRGEYEEEKFQGVNSELMETSQRTFRLAVLNLPVFQLVMYTAVV
uniref:ABC transporter transmembrane domain-containing protein n=1 Tax=uncultured Acidaminococcus sp. TaxID=352152 RepID=UPI00258EFB6D